MRILVIAAIVVAGLNTVFAGGAQAAPAPERAASATAKACTLSSLQGRFGFTSVGALLNLPPALNGPFGEVGRQAFDGRGNTEATATLSANGNIVRITAQGVYLVNTDCTGSMHLFIPQFGSTVDLDFVLDDNGNELRAIVTAAGAIETRIYRKQIPNSRED